MIHQQKIQVDDRRNNLGLSATGLTESNGCRKFCSACKQSRLDLQESWSLALTRLVYEWESIIILSSNKGSLSTESYLRRFEGLRLTVTSPPKYKSSNSGGYPHMVFLVRWLVRLKIGSTILSFHDNWIYTLKPRAMCGRSLSSSQTHSKSSTSLTAVFCSVK